MISSIFANPYFLAFGVPIVFLLVGAFTKKLVRATAWQSKDFFLGVESTLAALSSGLINIFDLVKLANPHSQIVATGSTAADIGSKLAATGGFLAITFFMLFVVLSFHQDWENKPGRGQVLRLAVFSNFIGFCLMLSFILVIKGVE